jgi:amino acid transporter
MHPRWKTPYIAMLIQAGISAALLLLSQYSETVNGAYQQLVDAAIILYFIPFLYMYAAAIRLAYRADRETNPNAVLVPGGRLGMWIAGLLGFIVTLVSIAFAVIPPGDVKSKAVFEFKLVGACVGAILIGLVLYWRSGSRKGA